MSVRRWHVAAGTLLCYLLLTLATAAGASAQEPVPEISVNTVTVTPSTGLLDGQTVTVEGFDYRTTQSVGVTVCRAGALESLLAGTPNLGEDCGARFINVVPDGSGHFVTPFVVFESQPAFFGGGTIDCSGPSACVVLAAQVFFAGGTVPEWIEIGDAPISFGPPMPSSKADCKDGGWRDVVDDEGRPFGNQGACITFVNHQSRGH